MAEKPWFTPRKPYTQIQITLAWQPILHDLNLETLALHSPLKLINQSKIKALPVLP
jgi:hypothetical protein